MIGSVHVYLSHTVIGVRSLQSIQFELSLFGYRPVIGHPHDSHINYIVRTL